MITEKFLRDILFPHGKVRKIQDEMIVAVSSALRSGKSLIMHAPTGIGKTAGVLAPALSRAIPKKQTIFFVTNRHTQHLIAISTLKKISHRHSIPLFVSDIIGKKLMCLVPGVEALFSSEFSDYCRSMREDSKCEFYARTKKSSKPSTEAAAAVSEISKISPCPVETVISICRHYKVCPYEISAMLAKKSNVIVADYNYIFNPSIRDSFLRRIDKSMDEIIVIADEGHNIPSRVRDLMTERLSSLMLKRSVTEAKKMGYHEASFTLSEIKSVIENLASDLAENQEKLVSKEDFIRRIEKISDYKEIASDLEFIGDAVREAKKQSSIGSVARFLVSWLGPEKGFVRIIEKKHKAAVLSYRCLDPSIVTKPVFDNAYSSIIMSGTLTPTFMYKDLLGIENSIEKTYKSPFPDKNKLYLVVPETTTKYSMRDQKQYQRIAEICSLISNNVPGCSAIFFPSYMVRDMVNSYFAKLSRKTVFSEQAGLTKEQKSDLLEKFKSYKNSGAVLMCVASGSFGEGIDLPGVLKCVIVVGIPLQKPDLETNALINYYNEKYRQGWNYGYIFPAFNKSIQSAGRCIRSSTDRGVMVFLDIRYAWPTYMKCFPPDWDVKVTKDYMKEIAGFFYKTN